MRRLSWQIGGSGFSAPPAYWWSMEMAEIDEWYGWAMKELKAEGDAKKRASAEAEKRARER